MRGKVVRYAVMGMLGVSTIALGAGYKWTGSGVDDAWDTYQNWDCKVGPCSIQSYPNNAKDDVAITSGTWDVEIVTTTIDDLTLEDATVAFSPVSGTPTLTVSTFTIVGGTTVTMSGTGIIMAE